MLVQKLMVDCLVSLVRTLNDHVFSFLSFHHTSFVAPTQTHILLRAPRHFSHPEWTPRQNFSRALEKNLTTFLNGAIVNTEQPSKPPTKPSYTIGSRTEGVWIGSKGQELRVNLTEPIGSNSNDDEMIWWSWNGKITGFSDW